ncbi:MAG: FumA C-terminus/TtdB family hydratase beta subunit [Candidatus Omnitrophica bacterium]|nr:FumA C-terminus/TtdB family hydratase beta subunit [Candidatus Omnitrophota bacterium]MDD5553589.1 FumA C-terminus/TtdB family hydratase beta subunit [Candidatus Omnitrophota bacterium]
MKSLTTPLSKRDIEELAVGEQVYLTGTIYTARDQAHKKLAEAIEKNRKIPIDLNGKVIYYCGPTPARPGKATGAAGPTTSGRMDKFTPALLKKGVFAMIGKGKRSGEVIKAIKKHSAVYFLSYAGCGALLSTYIEKSEPVAFTELGPEAIYKMEVRNLPLFVGIDSRGNDIFEKRAPIKGRKRRVS